MSLDERQTRKLMEYEGKLDIKQLVLSFAITRNRLNYRKDNSPTSVTTITQNLNEVLQKYGAAAQPDYVTMTNL